MTPRGRDFIKAIVLTTVVSALTDLTMLLALALVLCIVAFTSMLFLRAAPTRLLEVHFTPESVRVFKGDAAETVVRLQTETGVWGIVKLAAIVPPKGVLATLSPSKDESYSLRLETKFAGRFEGFTARVELPDALGLFTRAEVAEKTPLRLDSLPLGLLAHPSVVGLSAIALGEEPSGMRGLGQEFYAAEPYAGVSEAHDILWKRIAEADDELVVVKLREANVPEAVHVWFLELEERGLELPRWMDLVSEATSRMGRCLLEAGAGMVLISRRRGTVAVLDAGSLTRLADATMEMWTAGSPESRVLESHNPQMVVTGMKELGNREIASLVATIPSIVVAEEKSEGYLGDRTIVFVGSEDVGRLVQAVLIQ
ncbi:MAG: hypothetical protein ABSB26_05430 [Nitrososphaerales archaeon]